MYMWGQICKNAFCTSSNTIFSRCFFALICFLVSVSQGWTPVSDRSGGGRRSLLSGSGGRHHRAHPPLHPGSCSQHLQCHADEPQLCSSNACAAQLAAPPHQVRIQSDMHSENGWKRSEKWDHTVTVLLLVALRTFADSTPSVPKKTSEWEREGVSLWSTPLSEPPPCATRVYRSRGGPPPEREEVVAQWLVTHDAACLREPSLKTLKVRTHPKHGPTTSHWALRLWMVERSMPNHIISVNSVPKVIL